MKATLVALLSSVAVAQSADMPSFPKLAFAKILPLYAATEMRQPATNTTVSLAVSKSKTSPSTNEIRADMRLDLSNPPKIWDRMDVTTDLMSGGRLAEDRYSFSAIQLPRGWIAGPGIHSRYLTWKSGPEKESTAIILRFWRPNKN